VAKINEPKTNTQPTANAGKEYLSKEKFGQLKIELEDLKSKKRKEIAEELEFAKSLGDLSENAEYHEAREAQAALEERIAQLESILANAEIVTAHHSSIVEVGSVVNVQKLSDKSKRKYTIVGSEETDTAAGKISFKSPLGQALLGKKKGEEFAFKTPAGEVKYAVVSIE
jgi:transcription elongation factor GreA